MYVLLDIDGVMIPAKSWEAPRMLEDGFPAFSEKAVSALNKILEETGASIVLTTSHKNNYPIEHLQEIFIRRGIKASMEKLETNSLEMSRGDEILAWIAVNCERNKFVIIDDDKFLNALPAEIKRKIVLTISSLGMDDEAAIKAIEILRSFTN